MTPTPRNRLPIDGCYLGLFAATRPTRDQTWQSTTRTLACEDVVITFTAGDEQALSARAGTLVEATHVTTVGIAALLEWLCTPPSPYVKKARP